MEGLIAIEVQGGRSSPPPLPQVPGSINRHTLSAFMAHTPTPTHNGPTVNHASPYLEDPCRPPTV